MEIEVGEYVRTFNGIFKVIAIDELYIYLDKLYFDKQYQTVRNVTFKERIVKHSKNIIDLIEVGDYVNGHKVVTIDTDAPNNCKECIELDRNNAYEYQWISKNEIETILTKEQYIQNCYTVERKEVKIKDSVDLKE